MENPNHKKVYDPTPYLYDCEIVDLIDRCKMNVKHKSIKIEMNRENFAVQQLPLFNRLEPEGEIGLRLSSVRGGRVLNTMNQKICTLGKKKLLEQVWL